MYKYIDTMSSVGNFRQVICDRLTAAAQEIFTVFEETIVQYEEEIRRQRKLLETVLKPEIKLQRIDLQQQLEPPHNQESNLSPVQEEQELIKEEQEQTKEEPEELLTSQDGDQLPLKQETDSITVTPTFDESEHRESEPDQLFSHNSLKEQEGSPHVDPTVNNDDDAPMLESQSNINAAKEFVNTSQSVTKTFRCSVCGKCFPRHQHLNGHIKTHSAEKRHPCTTCGSVFSCRKNLAEHMRTHAAKKPFRCAKCGNGFSHRHGLKVHSRSHTDPSLYWCEICGKSFASDQSLNVHIRTHLSLRPFSCRICGERFSYSRSLGIHMRTHADKSPDVCF